MSQDKLPPKVVIKCTRSIGNFAVPSHSDKNRRYIVYIAKHPEAWDRCTCPDWFYRSQEVKNYECKHIKQAYKEQDLCLVVYQGPGKSGLPTRCPRCGSEVLTIYPRAGILLDTNGDQEKTDVQEW